MMGRREVTALLAASIASCSRAVATRKLRVSVAASSVAQLHVYLAESLGFFKQDGLDVELEETNSTSKTMEALLGGSVEVCASTYEQTVQAASMGREIKSFFLLFTFPNNVVVGSPSWPEIVSIAHLKHRTVGVTALGSASQNYLNLTLLRRGMKPADVTPVAIGASASAVAAVENGKVDAAVLTSLSFEVLRARHPEVKVLADLRTPAGTAALFGAPHVPIGAAVASSRWLAGNRDAACRVARALGRAAQWIHQRSAAEIAANLPHSLRTPGSEAALRSLQYAMLGLSRDGRMPRGGPEAIHDYLKLAVDPSIEVDLATTYTNEYLEANP